MNFRSCEFFNVHWHFDTSILTRYRRYAYFILLVFGSCLTPADFISDLAMTAPLILLYEVSVTLSKLIYKRKQRKYKDK